MKLYYFNVYDDEVEAYTDYNVACAAATAFSTKENLRWVPTVKSLDVEVGAPVVVPTARHPLDDVYKNCVEQASVGKGDTKHGLGKDFYEQQWVDVTRRHGVGFLTGQAVKKLNEAAALKNNMTQEDWEQEMHGAINYAAMAVLYRKLYGDK